MSMPERAIRWIAAAAASTAVALAAGFARAQDRAPDVWFVPTPIEVVDRMLELAKVGPNDVVYDLGSGDGRIVITAATRLGARGVGYEINPVYARQAEGYARALGVSDRVQFRVDDLFEADLSEATVVTMYLLPHLNLKLKPKLERLAPGTRIVSHEYGIGDWTPDHSEEMVIRGERHRIHLWTVRAR